LSTIWREAAAKTRTYGSPDTPSSQPRAALQLLQACGQKQFAEQANQGWAYPANIGILHAFVSSPIRYPQMDDRRGASPRARLVTSQALFENAILQAGADSQKLTKPAHEKPATSRLFNACLKRSIFAGCP
jgi:hypothetical protein